MDFEFISKDYEVWNNMGNKYSFKGEKNQAIDCWNKAVEIKPDKFETWFNFAIMHRELRIYNLAPFISPHTLNMTLRVLVYLNDTKILILGK